MFSQGEQKRHNKVHVCVWQGAYDDSQDTCLKCDDSDTDDDDSVCYHDDAESSEEEEAVKVKRDLEWDDSTLSF